MKGSNEGIDPLAGAMGFCSRRSVLPLSATINRDAWIQEAKSAVMLGIR